jgi:amidase
MTSSDDLDGAFIERFEVPPTRSGALDGTTFAVKDLIDIAGRVSGCGNPRWRETHPPASAHAVVVELLLSSGATAVGKTITDELAFSIVGENAHYGTPRNPRAPARVPGGSSSGSASAVACGECDFAIGTDTTGSVRVPAANCGLFGMRPSHDRVSLAGVMPFAPSFDTVGVLARNAPMLERAMSVLLGVEVPEGAARKGATAGVTAAGAIDETVAVLRDAWDLCEPEVASVCRRWLAAHALEGAEITLDALTGNGASADEWLTTHCQLQWAEIDCSIGGWVSSAKPQFGPLIAANFGLLAAIDRPGLRDAVRRRRELAMHLGNWLAPGRLLCFPTTSAPAPRKGSLFGDRRSDAYMQPTLTLQTFATIARLPQVTMPAGDVDGAPVGISFLAARDHDAELLAWVRSIADRASPARTSRT